MLTSAQVAAAIPGVHEICFGWFADDYKPHYPQMAAVPNVFGDKTQTLEFDGLAVKLYVLGRGCSAAQIGDAVFVGDLVNPDNHAWLELGFIDEWLARLEEIRA